MQISIKISFKYLQGKKESDNLRTMFILRVLLKKVLFKRFMALCLHVRWEQNQDWRNCLVATNNLLSPFMVHTFWSWNGCILVYMDCICIRISQHFLDTVPAQPSGTVLAIAEERLWLYLKAMHLVWIHRAWHGEQQLRNGTLTPAHHD